MSLISDVVLFVNYAEPGLIAALNGPIPGRSDHLAQMDTDFAGGNKVFTAEVWMGSFNYLDLDVFVSWVESAPWGDGYVEGVLIVDHQDGSEVIVRRFGESDDIPRPQTVDGEIVQAAITSSRSSDAD
jgi:hypothetical protein